MLPFLPALILLLLHGPANIERLAEGGALPAALAAIQQRIDAPEHRALASKRADQLALASLLALSGDKEISNALARILAVNIVCETPAQAKPAILESEQTQDSDPPKERCLGRPQDGFIGSQRSRDGPSR